MAAQIGPRRRAERIGLQEAQRRPHRVLPEYPERGVDRALGPDVQRGGGEELSDVRVEECAPRRDLAEPEVGEPRVAGGIDEDGGEGHAAVRDAVLSERGDEAPHLPQEVVGDVVVGEGGEGPAVDRVERDQHRIRAHFGDRAHARRPDADVTGLERHQRLVLDGAPE